MTDRDRRPPLPGTAGFSAASLLNPKAAKQRVASGSGAKGCAGSTGSAKGASSSSSPTASDLNGAHLDASLAYQTHSTSPSEPSSTEHEEVAKHLCHITQTSLASVPPLPRDDTKMTSHSPPLPMADQSDLHDTMTSHEPPADPASEAAQPLPRPSQPMNAHFALNGTGSRAGSSNPSSRVSSVTAQPDFTFTSAQGSDVDMSDGDFGQSRFLEQMHGAKQREMHPAKKLKVHPTNAEDATEAASGHERSGLVGQWLQQQKRDGQVEATRDFVNLESNGASSTDPIDIDTPTNGSLNGDANGKTTQPTESTGKVVDLTNGTSHESGLETKLMRIDDDVEIIPNPEEDREVCYGKIEGAQAYAHTIPHPKDHKGVTNDASMWKVLPCTIFREPLRHFVIHLRDPHGKTFATVDTRVARALAPLLDTKFIPLKVDARLDPRKRHGNEFIGKEVSEYWRLTLNLYGPKKHAVTVGKALSQKNVWLGTPYAVRYGVQIFNPHVQDRAAISKARWVHRNENTSRSFVVRTNEEIAQDISGIFNSLSNTDEMPEAEPDKCVKTDLLRHQKQAIHFMTKRETVSNDPAVTNPLWREKTRSDGRKTYYNVITGNEQPNPPAPVLGGILADQMGLGKTLETVAFICSTLDEAKIWADESKDATAEDGTALDNLKCTLLVCPKNVAGEWQDQINMHLKKNTLKTYFYHGTNRNQDKKFLREHDVIITTYSIVANELRRGKRHDKRSIFATTNWFRVVLDEAHAIREQNTLQSKAICALHASRRWALTGTPVQNRLEDLGALIKFLRIKPFDELSAFAQYIMTSFKLKDQEALPKLRLLVDSFTLRRLKDKIDLPPRTEEIVELPFSPDEAALHNWFTKDASNKMRVMQNKKKHLTGRSYQNVLRSILCLRLVSVHGRELLHEDDIQMIQGVSSEQPIDLDMEQSEPALTARAAYEMLMLMDSANRQQCNKCGKDVRAKEEEDDKDEPFGTMLPCYDLICNDCIRDVKKAIKEQAKGDRFNCPFCDAYQKVSYFELTLNGAEEAEADREQAKLNPRQAKVLGRYKGPHTKTYALIDHLKANEAESQASPGEAPIKSVVFTEWTSHLDLIEIALEDLVPEIGYVRFDGKMNVKQQKAALDKFRTDASVRVIVVSIRAGGVGLNLTTASRVYVMEPQWNPAAEAQAVDRVHRLGQTRPVKIVRFIMAQSIEETMQKLQGKKKRMAEVSLNRNFSRQQASAENMEEFKDLFSKRL